MSENEELLKALERRRPGLEQYVTAWRKVADVMNGSIKTADGDQWKSRYIPQGRLEPATEYSLRVELTPWFPQTPQTVTARLGALFEKGLEIEAAGLEEFIAHAGRTNGTFEDIASAAAMYVQVYGFCACELDHAAMPGDTAGRMITEEERASRGLNRPYLAIYTPPSILDWDYAGDGRLAWVKFGETITKRETWDGRTNEELLFRIIDRTAVTIYHVTTDENGEVRIVQDKPIPHGFAERVPVVFCHPFPDENGIGNSILKRNAESDICATRVLSDLVWAMFLLGNPILTLTTARTDDQLSKLGMGASRYIPLKSGNKHTGEEAEKLDFVQLDSTGIDLMLRTHTLFAAEGSDQKTIGQETSVGIPQQASGISQAWRFKTGEERILFLLARALEPFLTECLELASLALGTAGKPAVTIPLNFAEMETLK